MLSFQSRCAPHPTPPSYIQCFQKNCRRHFLQCPSSLLSKNFEKLLQCDQRLNQLSQQPDIILDSPVFEPRCSIFEDPVESKCQGFTNLKDEHELSGFSGSLSPCAGSSMSAKIEVNDSIATQAGFLAQPGNPGKLPMMPFPLSLFLHFLSLTRYIAGRCIAIFLRITTFSYFNRFSTTIFLVI